MRMLIWLLAAAVTALMSICVNAIACRVAPSALASQCQTLTTPPTAAEPAMPQGGVVR
jgi:hypothetical protein